MILLMVFIAVQSVGPYVTASLCKLNENYIAEKLCELRNSQKNTCPGKCYPSRQVRNNGCGKNACGNAPCKKAETSIATYLLPAGAFPIAYHTHNELAVKVPVVHRMLTQPYADSIFQPPRQVIA